MPWWKSRSKLGAVARATRDDVSAPAYVGEAGWRDRLYQSVTDRKRRENAIQGAKLGATAALVPVALGALAYQREYRKRARNTNMEVARQDIARAVATTAKAAVAGAAGGFVAGPLGGVAAAAYVSSMSAPALSAVADRARKGNNDGNSRPRQINTWRVSRADSDPDDVGTLYPLHDHSITMGYASHRRRL
jgi:hypothetical protein